MDVEWQVVDEEAFWRVVCRGVVRATAELAHSVHAEAKGLRPDRVYWYRFRAGQALSPIGRTRSAPSYRGMAARDLDLVVHLGDYIYEKSWGSHHSASTASEFRRRSRNSATAMRSRAIPTCKRRTLPFSGLRSGTTTR